MGTKTYSGRRDKRGIARVAVISGDGDSTLLNWRLDLANHSPSGLEWGFLGSGPHQLSLALLADATGDAAMALRHYRQFARCVIYMLPRDGWKLTERDVLYYLREVALAYGNGNGNVD